MSADARTSRIATRALRALQDGRFPAVLTDAVEASYRRTLELGTELEEQVAAEPER